jgi:hypothetical protein
LSSWRKIIFAWEFMDVVNDNLYQDGGLWIVPSRTYYTRVLTVTRQNNTSTASSIVIFDRVKFSNLIEFKAKLFLRESSWTLLTIIYTKMEVCELNQWRPIQSENLIEKCWYITNNLVHFLLSQISSSDHQRVLILFCFQSAKYR